MYQHPTQQWPPAPPQRRGVPSWVWIVGAGGALFLMLVVIVAATTKPPAPGAVSSTPVSSSSARSTSAAKPARHRVTAAQVEPAAQVAASDDGASDVAPYVAALTTLGNRCTQKPIDILTDDVLTAQFVMKQAGDAETKLAVMKAMIKVSSAASDVRSGHQDCEAIAKALSIGVAGK